MTAAVDRVSKQISDKFGVSAEEAREISQQALFTKSVSAGGNLGASVGKLLGKLGIGLEGGGGLRGEKRDNESARVQAKNQQAFDEAYNTFTDREAREAWSLHEHTRSADQARQGYSTSRGERENATAGTARESQKQEGLRELASTLESLSTRMSQAEGSSVTLNQDQTSALVQYISRQSGRPESQVATQIGEAVKFNLMERSGIGEKTVSQWAQEWYDHNRPDKKGFMKKTSSLNENTPAHIQGERDAIFSKQDEIESSVRSQQGEIHADMERERSGVMTQGKGIKQNIGRESKGIEAKIDSGKAEISGKKGTIDQTGEDLKGRNKDLQSEEVDLSNTIKKGLMGDRLSEGRKKLFEGTPPHPNFYPELRLRNMEKKQKKED